MKSRQSKHDETRGDDHMNGDEANQGHCDELYIACAIAFHEHMAVPILSFFRYRVEETAQARPSRNHGVTLWKFWDIGTLKKSENFEFRNSGDRNFSLNPRGELGITGVWRVLEIEFWLNFGNLELKMIIWELGITKKGRNFEFGSSELRSFRTNSPLKTSIMSPH